MTTSQYNCSRWHIDATIVAHMERDSACSTFFLLVPLLLLCLSYYFCHYCILNLSSPLILSINNMSLYHLPFLADVGRNKLHKDYTNIGIGEEPNRSDNPLLLFSPLLFYYLCHYCTLNLSSPFILSITNMSLYHLPFLADVGRNKLHKDYTNFGIGEEPNRSDNPLLLFSPLLSYYLCHYCPLNLSLTLILSVTNMSLYHLPFLADVGRNKLHKDYTNFGIGEEPNRSDKLLLVTSFSSFLLFLFLSLIFLALIYAIYTKFYFIFIYLLLFYSKIPLTF